MQVVSSRRQQGERTVAVGNCLRGPFVAASPYTSADCVRARTVAWAIPMFSCCMIQLQPLHEQTAKQQLHPGDKHHAVLAVLHGKCCLDMFP